MLAWYKVVRAADWSSLADVRTSFPSADRVGMVLVFDVLHNQVRLITVAAWRSKRIFCRSASDAIKALLTHSQYDRKEWMNGH